ncbi:Phosphoribosylamine--glycine ligase [Candidatus Gugararchaeum adminiculabundum]|nr:Phosphoribosylamine--glycine ligase [Candidatus Gugararchaeum adminiculabundum]
MNILLVGNGAREHAIADALCRNPGAVLYAYMGAKNPGIAELCLKSGGEFLIGDIYQGRAIAEWALERGIRLAVCGPDAVLEAGVVDELEAEMIPCASPCKEAARLEWDKTFTRNLMKKYAIPGCPKFGNFTDADEAGKFIDQLKGEVAVKPAGLTGGKGVKVVGFQLKDANEAKDYAKEVLASNIGKLGSVVIEEKLSGEEFTLQAFVDGKNVFGMPMVQDHKRLGEGDVGVNTGGMGSYSIGKVLPFFKPEVYDEAIAIMKKTVAAFEKETGKQFKGVLYGQFMMGKTLEVIEFNSRFGDPEAMNVLSLLTSDFVEICKKIASGNLKQSDVRFDEGKASVVKYLVPQGYPEKPMKNQKLEIDAKGIAALGAKLFYASVDERDGSVYTGSSRAIGVLAVAERIETAEQIAEKACLLVKGPVAHRKDIGTRQLLQRRIDNMKRFGNA